MEDINLYLVSMYTKPRELLLILLHFKSQPGTRVVITEVLAPGKPFILSCSWLPGSLKPGALAP